MIFKRPFNTIWIYLGLLVLLTVPLCWRIFGNDLINAHDSMAGLIRALSMNENMGRGQWLVRWAPGINWGYGYPMFNFYPPFFSCTAVLFFQLTHHMVLAMNLSCSLFWLLSGIGMFLFAREFWGDEGGMFSAVLYLWAPYHMIDLYVRGAFAEFSSFAFFPFLLLFILKMSRNMGLGIFCLGIASVFGLSLTHNIMSMLFFPVAVAYMLFLYFTKKRSVWILWTVDAFVVGLMMSSFFWLPALVEKQFLNLDFLISMRYDFHKSFVSWAELFWPMNKDTVDGISFQVGVLHSLVALCTLIFLPRIFKISKALGFSYIFFFMVGFSAVFFSLSMSHPFWERISMLRFVQFPWRFLTIIVFAISFLCGSLGLIIRNPLIRNVLLIMAGIAAICISLNTVPKPTFVDHERTPENFLAMGEGEYTPRWIMVPPNGFPSRKFEIVHGSGQLGDEKVINPVHYETTFQAAEASALCFHSFYFPGWKVLVDGQSVDPNLKNPFGVILFFVPPGNHDIEVVFGPTGIRIMAVIISWLGFILLLACIWRIKFASKSVPI